MDAGQRIHPAQARLEAVEFGRGQQVRFIEQQDIGERDLRGGLGRGREFLVHMPRVHDCHDAVESQLPFQFGLQKRVGNRTRIGEAGGLDQYVIEAFLLLEQIGEALDQVTAHAAAEAAVVEFDHLLVHADHELVVDAQRTEFIDDDRAFVAVGLAEEMVEQGRLAGAEEAGEHGDGDTVFDFHADRAGMTGGVG